MRNWMVAAAATLAAAGSAFADGPSPSKFEALVNDMLAMVQQDREDVYTRLRLAAMLEGMGQADEARRLFREALELDPSLGEGFGLGEDGAPCADCPRASGPDVIVGDLNGIGNFNFGSPVNGRISFSVGTTSCNVGDQQLLWFQPTNQHPVIAQNIYRIFNGRIEQIGQGWLKHGFCALQLNLCGTCTNPTGGCEQVLFPGCSDPYSASLNGDQSLLGPKWQVNPSTGVFPYPINPIPPFNTTSIDRRIQVLQNDMDPNLFPYWNPTTNPTGAIFLAEGQYVTQDDAAAGNALNNSSYRRMNLFWNAANRTVQSATFTAPTVRTKPAIVGWQDIDPSVTVVNLDIPGDGRVIVAYKITNNGNGTWDYEYAVYNLNSDRAVSAFSIPVRGLTQVSNVGFKDIDYHSGDGWNSSFTSPVTFDGTDWPGALANQALRWNTQTFAQNPNANALRWSTLYNFRFRSNAPPVPVNATITTFKNPADFTVALQGPACLLVGDFNGDNQVNFTDLNLVLSAFGSTYSFQDLNNVLSAFGRNCF